MISIYNYFSSLYIYPRMDPVNPQYILMSSLLKRTISEENMYFIAFYTKLQRIQDNLDI